MSAQLRFSPYLTLIAAARIAAEHGLRLELAMLADGFRVITKPLEEPAIPQYLQASEEIIREKQRQIRQLSAERRARKVKA